MNGFFITGSDTDVGKTYVSVQIISELVKRGINVIPRKPVESGCELVDGKLYPADADKLLKASQSAQTLEDVCPYRFAPAISPQLAARHANTPIQLQQLVEACTNNIQDNDFLIVEGAGGFYSPICEAALNADLAKKLNLPVILVVDDRLGSVNQALLTLSAITASNIKPRTIILNRVSNEPLDEMVKNTEELKSFINFPLIHIAHGELMSNSQLDDILSAD